jgi:uncharacterized protein (UPF0332 family)
LPTKEEHLEKATSNEKLAEVLCQTNFLDWAVTAYFYSALHYCHIILAINGQHPASHEATGPLVRKNPVLKKIWAEYRSLHTASRNARYYATQISPEHLANVQLDFQALRTYIREQLRLDRS